MRRIGPQRGVISAGPSASPARVTRKSPTASGDEMVVTQLKGDEPQSPVACAPAGTETSGKGRPGLVAEPLGHWNDDLLRQ